jgi:hypothetical protein
MLPNDVGFMILRVKSADSELRCRPACSAVVLYRTLISRFIVRDKFISVISDAI